MGLNIEGPRAAPHPSWPRLACPLGPLSTKPASIKAVAWEPLWAGSALPGTSARPLAQPSLPRSRISHPHTPQLSLGGLQGLNTSECQEGRMEIQAADTTREVALQLR